MRVFPSGIGSKIPRADEALSKATLTRILLGRVLYSPVSTWLVSEEKDREEKEPYRDAGSGAKVQLKTVLTITLISFRKDSAAYGYQPKHR